jgi:hypothetical protein
MQEIVYFYNPIIIITKVELINQVSRLNEKLVIIVHQGKQNPSRITTTPTPTTTIIIIVIIIILITITIILILIGNQRKDNEANLH